MRQVRSPLTGVPGSIQTKCISGGSRARRCHISLSYFAVKPLSRIVERLALIVLLVGGLGMLFSMFLGVADIVGTQVLLIPVPGPRELTESTMVLIVFGALAYAQIRRAHIRVELLYLKMPPRGRAVMDVITDLAAIAFFGLILSEAISEAQYSYQIKEATTGLILSLIHI